MIFWWTGRGYLALLSLIGVFGLFGALAFGEQVFDTAPWLWAVGAVITAVVNWVIGCRVNRRPIQVPRLANWKSRFTYRPPNRFMGLPLEVWSAPMLLLALVLLVRGLLPS